MVNIPRPTHYDIILHCYPQVFVVNTSGPGSNLAGPSHDYKNVLLDLNYGEFLTNPMPEAGFWVGWFMGKEIIIRPWDMESPGTALNVFFRREDKREAMAFKLAYC